MASCVVVSSGPTVRLWRGSLIPSSFPNVTRCARQRASAAPAARGESSLDERCDSASESPGRIHSKKPGPRRRAILARVLVFDLLRYGDMCCARFRARPERAAEGRLRESMTRCEHRARAGNGRLTSGRSVAAGKGCVIGPMRRTIRPASPDWRALKLGAADMMGASGRAARLGTVSARCSWPSLLQGGCSMSEHRTGLPTERTRVEAAAGLKTKAAVRNAEDERRPLGEPGSRGCEVQDDVGSNPAHPTY